MKVDPRVAREARKYAMLGLIKAGFKTAPPKPKLERKVCQNCGQSFGGPANYKRHVTTSWCSRNKKKLAKEVRRNNKLNGIVDPVRPELGKVPKGTLAHAALTGKKLRIR
jgi:hypothetical protein